MSALSESVLASIRDAATTLRPELIDLLQQAVRIPSINPARHGAGEGNFQTFISEQLARLGGRVDVWEPDGTELSECYGSALATSTRDFVGRPNVVGVFGPSDPQTRAVHLILNSHADTVGVDPTRWEHDPFAGTIEDGRLYGLGSADAKGCLLTFLGALSVLGTAGLRLRRSLALASVVDEEAGGGGTLACIERDYRATGALVGEPTSLRICPGSRGAFGVVLTVEGKGAHLGVAYEGMNAIDLSERYIRVFHNLSSELDREYRHPFWQTLPVGHVFSVTSLTSEPSLGSVPSHCEVRFSAGFIAGETREQIEERLRQAFERVTRNDPWLAEHPPAIELTGPYFDPAAANEDHQLIVDLIASGRDLGLGDFPVHALSAGTDGRFLTNIGQTPAINFGPGAMARAHNPDEYINLSEYLQAIVWVAIAVARYCGVEEESSDAGSNTDV